MKKINAKKTQARAAIDTTDPRADYPPGQEYVNRGDDWRISGALGKKMALIQRLNSFKCDPPTNEVEELPGGCLFEWGVVIEPRTGKRRPHVALAIPYGKRWATGRFLWLYDGNWGDENVRGFNPNPEKVGGAIFDWRVKLRAREPFIDRP